MTTDPRFERRDPASGRGELAALSAFYVDKVNRALARGDRRVASELAAAFADEALEQMLETTPGPFPSARCAETPRRARGWWAWTGR